MAGFALPTADPIIQLKERIDNGKNVFSNGGSRNRGLDDSITTIAPNVTEGPDKRSIEKPTVLEDVSLCQQEQKISCYSLLYKSLNNIEQMEYKSNCTEQTISKYRKYLGYNEFEDKEF